MKSWTRLKQAIASHQRFSALMLAAVILTAGLFAIPHLGMLQAAETATYSLLDAKENGVVIKGEAKGTLTSTYDESARKDVLELDYTLAPNSSLVVWTKNFPAAVTPESVNLLKAGIKTLEASQAAQISIAMEIRGTVNTQSVPVSVRSGWSNAQASIDWSTIGNLDQIVFIISPKSATETVKGTLDFTSDLSFRAPIVKTVKAKVADVIPAATKEATEVVEKIAPKIETPNIEMPAAQPAQVKTSYSHLDAKENGADAGEASKGTVTSTFDEAMGKDVIELDYVLPQKGSVKLWTKDYPETLTGEVINTVKLGIRLLDDAQAKSISTQLEIKGSQGTQTIPLQLKSGWNSIQQSIDWSSIAALKEVSLILNPETTGSEAKGTLDFSLEFVKRKSTEVKNSGPLPAYTLFDAGEKGVFNIGNSSGNVAVAYDETLEKDVWKFDYNLPQGTVVGVWSKTFPEGLKPANADAVRVGVKIPENQNARQAAVKIEVKGSLDTQIIPILQLKTGWNSLREFIRWNKIGELREFVFVVSPMIVPPMNAKPEEIKPVMGSFFFDFDFNQTTFVERHATFLKLGLVLLTALIFSWFAGLVLKSSKSATPEKPKESPKGFSGRDFFTGTMTIFILALAIRIYSLGTSGILDVGFSWTFLAVALAGGLIAELLKIRLTGKHLSRGEVFQNIFLTGMLAVASSRLDLLQAPAGWSELFQINKLTACIAFLIYQIFNANSMCSSGKHLKKTPAFMIVLTPFLFGWLLLLENPILLQKLGLGLTLTLTKAWPAMAEFLGRALVLFLFNEIVTNSFGMLTKGRILKTAKAHWILLGVSLGATAAPMIAGLASSAGVASLPILLQAVIAVIATGLSFAGLWGEVYLLTGIFLDAGKNAAPTPENIFKNIDTGARKGFAYSSILMAILYALQITLKLSFVHSAMTSSPIFIGILAGALIFPFLKTIIETFDGSLPFFERTAYSYQNGWLYLRGAIAGYGFAVMFSQGMFTKAMPDRIVFGLMMGLLASGGVSLLRDIFYGLRHQGKIQTWKLYFTDSIFGIFVGSAVAFYLDAAQVPVIVEKFKLYTSSGFDPIAYNTIPLLNKWGRIDLGHYSGGVKLIFLESLAGVINWSIAAWLFAINKVFLQSIFEKDTTPIKFFFSKAGFASLIENLIYVLRWGLWMSPIIATFLRVMPEPTWYNQDGAIRTLFAIWHNTTSSPTDFHNWSLQVFLWMMAFDFLRILIWMDHMGLRVATLVNLSFIGMDRLDEKLSRFIGPAAAQRYIPEGVKRFTTWAPLLIPFYIPRGAEWEYVWSASEAMQNANRGKGLLAFLQSLSAGQMFFLMAGAILVCSFFAFLIRASRERAAKKALASFELSNREYKVTAKANAEVYSELTGKECDISRRSYDFMDPTGRILFIVDTTDAAKGKIVSWPIMGNCPREYFPNASVEKVEDSLKLTQTHNGVKSTIEIRLPDQDSPVELWNITVENLTEKPRQLKVVSYLEWVLNGWMHDRFHTQYARLYPEMEYVSGANAIISWQKSTKSMGFMASDLAPEGFLTGRVDFIGRGKSVWTPRALETLDFLPAKDTPACPTFDPIGSLMVNAPVGAQASVSMKLVIGYSKNKGIALDLIQKFLKPLAPKSVPAAGKKRSLLIGHGEVYPKTPQPYFEFLDKGNTMRVLTPFTPRPFDHGMSNPTHSVMVTNRGLHTSCNGNSQQNRLTPDWPDTVTKEIPTEAIYLYDQDQKEWFSPTYHPINDVSAKHDCDFSVDGTAVFRMSKGTLSTELTVFVPTDEPTGIYLLRIKNTGNQTRRLRVAPYFQMVLSFQPERSGPLVTKHDKALNALYFSNPRNIFRNGWAFASMSVNPELVETKRGRFFGDGRGPSHPYLVEMGHPDEKESKDPGQIAAFLGSVEIPSHQEFTLAVVLGQTDSEKDAARIVQKYKNLENAKKSLESTRQWWLALMESAKVETNQPEFDRYQNWLKYQALAERIWARKGFYQTSGAYGFRDQLQDTINLIWMDPALARKQILLHASQQFLEGDVFHWFFTLVDGRTAFSCRSHASDNPLWLAWAAVEYIRMTGDDTILDEMASYVMSEFPFAQLPKNKGGWGHLYHRTTRGDTLYKHCMRSIDLVIKKRTGKHGLPLMGTGDWNDGLDEIGGEGHGESVWLGFFLYYILKEMVPIIERKEGAQKKAFYVQKLEALKECLETTWRGDRYLRAFHDDGTEIGVKDSGIWEIDALTAAWAVMAGMNFERAVTVFNTALQVLERGSCILLGWPALREDSKPYLGRSSKYPEGVRENGMYCHGVQWLVRAARLLAEEFEARKDHAKAEEYRATAYRLWQKVSPIAHVTPQEIEIYGGQPNKQPADFLTTFELGRMIWNGYTGAAGWMLRQAFEGVAGATLIRNQLVLPSDLDKPRGNLKITKVKRDISKSPLKKVPEAASVKTEKPSTPSRKLVGAHE